MDLTRPVMRYHGGKWMLAPWIIEHFPPHRIYTEAYGGAASVLMRKPRAKLVEVYNDLDGEIVSLFRLLRDPDTAGALARLLEATPFAREEFALSYEACEDALEQARRTLVRSFMGFGSDSASGRTAASISTPAFTLAGFSTCPRRKRNKNGSTSCDWRRRSEQPSERRDAFTSS